MKIKNLQKIKDMLFFTTSILKELDDSISAKAWESNISRWLKSGEIVRLKRGIFVHKSIFAKHNNNIRYAEYISSIIRYPSYLSLGYILQKYQMLTDSVYSYTSVTTLRPLSLNNKLGGFSYRSIKPDLFVGYNIENYLGNTYYVGTKAKALFDYLYLSYKSIPNPKINKVVNIASELRLNLDNFSVDDEKELVSYLEKVKNSTLEIIILNLIKNASNT